MRPAAASSQGRPPPTPGTTRFRPNVPRCAWPNSLFAERTNDLWDLQQRVLRVLLGADWQFDLLRGAIVAAHELTPADLLQLSAPRVARRCLAEGGATSHVAILTRGTGLPCQVALGAQVLDLPQGQAVVLAAPQGRLERTPDAQRIEQVRLQRHAQQQRRAPQ